jgi:hypothetical protein
MQWPLPANTNVFLGLWNGNGTPNTSLDDLAVFGDTGGRIPSAGDGWRSYDIAVRSSSERLPSGWIAYSAGFTYPPGTREADKIWQRVIGDVEQVMWSYGGPGTVNFLGSIDAGADNCSIVWQSAWQRGAEPTACSGDVTGPQDEPDGVIALDDLLAVLADFGAVVSDPSEGADATGDSRVDLDDLLLVLARFGTECS